MVVLSMVLFVLMLCMVLVDLVLLIMKNLFWLACLIVASILIFWLLLWFYSVFSLGVVWSRFVATCWLFCIVKLVVWCGLIEKLNVFSVFLKFWLRCWVSGRLSMFVILLMIGFLVLVVLSLALM